ncbi:hypothetical protein BDQ17DRAFT_184279 [Cyathus striatus]|nr:hypothetical protein BDQ17DRAFT_184279 [Cyathus striatus]
MGDLGVGVEMEMAIGIPPRVSIRPSGEVRRRPSSNHGPTNNGSGAGFQPSSMPTTTSNTTTTGPQTYPIQSRYTEEDNMILRTGEASRLRRRGALRLDYEHAQLFHATHTGGGMGGVWLPTPGEDGSAPSAPAPSGVGEGRRHRRATTVGTTARGGGEYSYILVCGGTIPSSPEPSPQAVKFNPSPLPLFPPTLSSQKPTYKTPQKASTTTGCGAIISMYTAPRPRVGVWAALSAGVSEAVVPMEKEYFEGVEDVLKGGIVKSACGCVKEGVGCRVW